MVLVIFRLLPDFYIENYEHGTVNNFCDFDKFLLDVDVFKIDNITRSIYIVSVEVSTEKRQILLVKFIVKRSRLKIEKNWRYWTLTSL